MAENRRRGFVGVAVYHPKTVANIGTLWRSADLLEADFFCTIGKRYQRQASDTMKSTRHIPLFEFVSFDDFYKHMPRDTLLVAVELTDDAVVLEDFDHPERAIYLLGAEDHGLPEEILSRAHRTVKLRGRRSPKPASKSPRDARRKDPGRHRCEGARQDRVQPQNRAQQHGAQARTAQGSNAEPMTIS